MGDRERSRAYFLNMIAQPDVITAVMALHEHHGSATLADLERAGVAHPAAVLVEEWSERTLPPPGHPHWLQRLGLRRRPHR